MRIMWGISKRGKFFQRGVSFWQEVTDSESLQEIKAPYLGVKELLNPFLQVSSGKTCRYLTDSF